MGRRVLAGMALCWCLAFALPAASQVVLDAAEIEREFGPRIESALNVCLTDADPNREAMEARAAEAGWPAFSTIGNWRVANFTRGDFVLLSFGIQPEPIMDATIPGTALTCAILVPQEVRSVLTSHLRARFSFCGDLGIFYLDRGVLRELPRGDWPDRDVPQLFEETPEDQRLVLLTTQQRGEMFVANVTVMHRAP